MSIGTILGLLAVGLIAGFLSSMVGIGGGTIIVPALVFMFAMSQKMAQGTSLAMMIPPIGILAVINYHKAGQVDFKIAAILCVSFLVGGYFGSKVVLNMDMLIVKKFFAVFLIIIALKYLFLDK
ncbi:MAG: sulfite exporter TauE/SafE family protein [Bacteroidota bacterium]